MNGQSLFVSLNSEILAKEICLAERAVCYAAPGILPAPASALADLAKRIGPELIKVCLDFDERVFRMGFGTLKAIESLREAGIEVDSIAGLRTGIVVIDESGYIFSPTALYLEAEPLPDLAPNAMRLAKYQAAEVLARLSPEAKTIAIALAKTEDERERIRNQAAEVPSEKVTEKQFSEVKQRLDEAPPVQFDIARQVRVFTAYIQYVDLSLSGAAIERRRVAIPGSIQSLGSGEDLEGRLRTTVDLVARGGKLSSKALHDALNQIRKDFTPSLGKKHGRVVLKGARPHLEDRLTKLRGELAEHQQRVERELQENLDESKKQIIEHYLPLVLSNPPDAVRGQFLVLGETEAKAWLESELDRVFPTADSMVKEMQLDVSYKDVTFETLDSDDFLEAVTTAFPHVNWDKAYADFLAASESQAGQ
jgi:hypothetical protein